MRPSRPWFGTVSERAPPGRATGPGPPQARPEGASAGCLCGSRPTRRPCDPWPLARTATLATATPARRCAPRRSAVSAAGSRDRFPPRRSAHLRRLAAPICAPPAETRRPGDRRGGSADLRLRRLARAGEPEQAPPARPNGYPGRFLVERPRVSPDGASGMPAGRAGRGVQGGVRRSRAPGHAARTTGSAAPAGRGERYVPHNHGAARQRAVSRRQTIRLWCQNINKHTHTACGDSRIAAGSIPASAHADHGYGGALLGLL